MYPDPTTFGFCNSEEKKKTKNERKGRGQRKKIRRKGSDHLLATHYWCLLLPSLSLSLSLSRAREQRKKGKEKRRLFVSKKTKKKRESSQWRFMGRVGWPHLYCHGDVVNSFLVRCWLVCLVRVRVRLCVRLCLVCRIVLLHKVLLLLHLLLLLLLRGGVRVRVRP